MVTMTFTGWKNSWTMNLINSIWARHGSYPSRQKRKSLEMNRKERRLKTKQKNAVRVGEDNPPQHLVTFLEQALTLKKRALRRS